MGRAHPSVRLLVLHLHSPNRGHSPSDFSATVCLRIYASFEFQPMLGNGEQLRELSTTVGQLLDHNASDLREWESFVYESEHS